MMADIKKLEVPESLSRLGETFRDAGHELYLVGGVVRGALLLSSDKDTATEAQINRQDADAATDAHPARIKELLGPHAENLWTVGERFGTIAATIGEYEIQITTYRTDQYTRGSRHPEVKFGDNLREDLARRDFTINAVAAEALTGEIVDPFEGRKDLERGVIRAVGDPLERMRDDPLRMLRAVRFETTLSKPEKPFAMTQDLEEAIRNNAGWLESISAERKREEFEKILVSENVASGLRALVRLGLMSYVVPEFMETVDVEQEAEFHHKDVFEHTLIVVSSVEADPILRKAAFFHDIGKPRTLVYEHRCNYCGAKSIRKSAEKGECEHCGGRTVPKKIHFYGHENVGAAIARRAMQRLAYPKDDRRRRPSRRQPHASLRVRRKQGPVERRCGQALYQGHVPRARRQSARGRGHAPQARQGRHHGERAAAEAHRRRVLAQPQEQGGPGKSRGCRREA